MKNKKVIRIVSGIKNIWHDKWKVVFPIIYVLIIFEIWKFGKDYMPLFNYLSLPQLYVWILGAFMLAMAVMGLLLILILLGTPIKSKETEKGLTEIGFVDNTGKSPTLLSKKKDKNGMILEFYSPRLPFYEYEEHRAEIETAMNIKIISVELGKDMQHVIIKAIASGGSTPKMIMWDDTYLDKNDFILKLGESYFGDESFDLAVMPHVLIGGGSGSGKSKLLKLILMQSIKKDAVVYLADFKGGVDYSKIWHEKCFIIVEAEKLLDQLDNILAIMEERRNLFVDSGTSNISEYNHKTDTNLQRIIFACDEIAELLDKTGLAKDEKAMISQIESKLSTIARQGRAFGIHLILATQRPDSDILKGQIKNNISMKICGRADKVLSQIILDNSDGADKISPNDQGMFLTNTKVLFKAYYIQEDCSL